MCVYRAQNDMFTEIAVAAGLPSGRELSLSTPVRDPSATLLHSLQCQRFSPDAPVTVQAEAEEVPQEKTAVVPTQGKAQHCPVAPFRWLWQTLEERKEKEKDLGASLHGKKHESEEKGLSQGFQGGW